MKTLLIDNYDSFTYNLYHLLAQVNGFAPTVVRNDEYNWHQLKDLDFDQIVISPGPGRPERAKDFGISAQVILHAKRPILGVCLGHQGIAHLHGGKVELAPEPVHGRISKILHNGDDLFAGLPSPFSATRYHSLVVSPDLPAHLLAQAWTEDGLIMGLRHRDLPLWGVQFHPESIDSEFGRELIANFRNLSLPYAETKKRIKAKSDQPSQPSSLRRKRIFRCLRRTLDMSADTESLFVSEFGNKPVAVWLDTARPMPGLGRFSYIVDTSGPLTEVIRYSASKRETTIERAGKVDAISIGVFDYLRDQLETRALCDKDLNLPFDFTGGYVGYLSYEVDKACGIDLNSSPQFAGDLPDAWWIFVDRLIVVDHQEEKTYLLALIENDLDKEASQWLDKTRERLLKLTQIETPPLASRTRPVTVHMRHDRDAYLDLVNQALKTLKDGESYELCLTNSLTTSETIDPTLLYRQLREINPAPFAAFIKDGESAVLSSSPERFLKLDQTGHLQARPIKGTRPRSLDAETDAKIARELETCEKDRAENRMIVDLLRNDLGRIARLGSVAVPESMKVESFASVHQLVSTVTCELAPQFTAVDAICAAFPGGSMTGAPKKRSLEILSSLEGAPRGVYSGVLGWIGLNGKMDLSIVIRTIVQVRDELAIGAGGAIIALSDPETEFEEMLLKARTPIAAIAQAVCGDRNNYVIVASEQDAKAQVADLAPDCH